MEEPSADCSRREWKQNEDIKKMSRKASVGRDFRKGGSRSRTNPFVRRRQPPFPKSASHFFVTSLSVSIFHPPSFGLGSSAHDCRRSTDRRLVVRVCLLRFLRITLLPYRKNWACDTFTPLRDRSHQVCQSHRRNDRGSLQFHNLQVQYKLCCSSTYMCRLRLRCQG